MNPLLIMALLSAASMAANHQAQNKVDKTTANAMADAARRRKESEKRSAASAQSTAQLLTGVPASEAGKAAEIEARYAANAPVPGAPMTSTAGSGFTAPPRSTLTVEDDQRAADRARADTDTVAKARANLNAYGDVMVDRRIAADANKSDIERENTGVRNWTNFVLPAKLNRANAAGQQWGTLADALQVAAAIYGPIGLSKGLVGGGLKGAFDVSTTSGVGGANPNYFAGLA